MEMFDVIYREKQMINLALNTNDEYEINTHTINKADNMPYVFFKCLKTISLRLNVGQWEPIYFVMQPTKNIYFSVVPMH